MIDSNLRKLNQLLKQYGYEKLSTINRDDYSRFNGIIVDRQGEKCFIKATIGKDSYEHKSLYREAQVTKYLSEKTKEIQIIHKGYRFYVPTVKEIIDKDGIFCLITHFVEGRRLVNESPVLQADVFLATLELVDKLSKEIRIFPIRSYLKNYTRKSLIFFLPIRLIKAVILCPSAAPLLVKAFWKALPIAYPDVNGYGLVHADINASNIISRKQDVYLTDWEEAGWGMSAYSAITPLCVHWQDQVLRGILLDRLQKNGQKKIIVPLLAYRTLMLFNQRHAEKESDKRKRDIIILRFLQTA